MTTIKLKIPLTPAGDNWLWSYFMNSIFDKLIEENLLKNDFDSHGQGRVFLRSKPYKKWNKAAVGSVLMMQIIEVAQKQGMPVIIEDNVPYFVMEEREAILQYLKYK